MFDLTGIPTLLDDGCLLGLEFRENDNYRSLSLHKMTLTGLEKIELFFSGVWIWMCFACHYLCDFVSSSTLAQGLVSEIRILVRTGAPTVGLQRECLYS